MKENFTSGSVGRAPGNRCPYPDSDTARGVCWRECRSSHFLTQSAIAYHATEAGVIALGKAQRILQGESPCRVRFNQPPVSSVGLVEELGN